LKWQKESAMRVFPNRFTPLLIASMLASAGCAGGINDPLAIPDTPDGTVQVVMDGLVQHHPEIIWRALPPSYRADVNELAASFADNMDPVLFDRTVAVARKASAVLQSKKDLVLATETVKSSGLDIETLDAAWEGGMFFLDALLASDLARLEVYPTLDVEAFLSSSGRQMMDHLTDFAAAEGGDENLAAKLTAFDSTRVELVRRDGDRATIRVTAPDEEPVDVEMIRVEERWLPVELASQWQAMIDKARERIEYLGSDESAQIRVQMLFAIGIAEGFVDQIDRMEVPEDLDKLIGGILGNVIQATGARES
jgi:hypothetical protein